MGKDRRGGDNNEPFKAKKQRIKVKVQNLYLGPVNSKC